MSALESRCPHGFIRSIVACSTCNLTEAAAARQPLPVVIKDAERAPKRGARQYRCSLCRSRAHSKLKCPQYIHPRIGRPNPNLTFRPVPAEFAEPAPERRQA